jgi:hypothetical protein
VREDFEGCGRRIVAADAEPIVREEQRRQGAGDEEEVVEPIMKKCDVGVWLQQPAIGRVEDAAREEQGVAQIAEPLQSKARMTRPNPAASETFRTTMDNVMGILSIKWRRSETAPMATGEIIPPLAQAVNSFAAVAGRGVSSVTFGWIRRKVVMKRA